MNPNSTLLRILAPAVLPVLLSATAGAGVIVVDDDGGAGVHFTDLQPAIAAAVSGDTILVHPGQYSGFVLAKGLTILGLGPDVEVAGISRVTGLPAGQVAVLAELEPVSLSVLYSQGTVVLDSIRTDPGPVTSGKRLLFVDGCTDVRAIRCSFSHYPLSTLGAKSATAVDVSGSRLELVGTEVAGEGAEEDFCNFTGQRGGDGLVAGLGARLHLAQTSVVGGEGGYIGSICGGCVQQSGDGGSGIELAGASTLFLMGPAPGLVQGGPAGYTEGCSCAGSGGTGLAVTGGATALYSGVQIKGGYVPGCASYGPAIQANGGTATQVMPPDPSLEYQGWPVAGLTIRFVVWGEPGDQVVLHLGRKPVVVPLPGVMIEQLTTQDRSISLGTIGAAGNKTFQFKIPVLLKQGFTFHAQAGVLRGGFELRTNSIPIVLR